MPQKPVFQNPDELKKMIFELSRELGPDHFRVKLLKADLSRKQASKKLTLFPALTNTVDELNKVTDAERGALESERRASVAATLQENIEVRNFVAAVNTAVAKQQQRDKK